jgi:hypothetical protein
MPPHWGHASRILGERIMAQGRLAGRARVRLRASRLNLPASTFGHAIEAVSGSERWLHGAAG